MSTLLAFQRQGEEKMLDLMRTRTINIERSFQVVDYQMHTQVPNWNRLKCKKFNVVRRIKSKVMFAMIIYGESTFCDVHLVLTPRCTQPARHIVDAHHCDVHSSWAEGSLDLLLCVRRTEIIKIAFGRNRNDKRMHGVNKVSSQ